MKVVEETNEYVLFEPVRAATYKVLKTDPPVLTVTIDYSHPSVKELPQTWAVLKAALEAVNP